MTKYHLTINGNYAPCTAQKRTCPRTTSGHIDENTYNALVEDGDLRTQPLQPIGKLDYLNEANIAYRNATKQFLRFRKVEVKANETINKLAAEENISQVRHSPSFIDNSKNKALNRLRELYIAEGVHPQKVNYLIEDVVTRDPLNLTPVVKRRADKYDPLLKEKTEAAARAAENDPTFKTAVQEYKNIVDLTQKQERFFHKAKQIKIDMLSQSGFATRDGYMLNEKLDDAATEFKKKLAWKEAHIPSGTKHALVENLSQEELSVDRSGKINNAWVETPNGIQKVVAYVPPTSNTWGSASGFLKTEEGTRIYHFTHYANFGSSVTGNTNPLLIGKKKGNDFSSDNFRLKGMVDSGD